MSILVVSATPEEAVHVPAAYRLLITGVGKVAAATAVATALARDPAITEVVNIGSAGALHDEHAGLYLVGSVHNHDLSAEALRGFGYEPHEWLELGDGVRLATGDLFVADAAVRSRLGQVADLVDMEGYAVVWAARQAGVPVTVIKHVSDQADEGAWQWAELVDRSARALAGWLVAERPVRPV